MKYIKEYNSLGYYYDINNSNNPSGVEDIKKIAIRDKNVTFIKRGLGIGEQIHNIGGPHDIYVGGFNGIGFCRFSYNKVTGDIGGIDIGNMNVRRTVYIYEYEDEWFKVYIDKIAYWCDQVDSVVSCIKNVIKNDKLATKVIKDIRNEVYKGI